MKRRLISVVVAALFIALILFVWKTNIVTKLALNVTPSVSESGINSTGVQEGNHKLQKAFDGGLINLKFIFVAKKNSGYPNLFQTGDYNTGIRAEFSNKSFGVIYASQPKGDPVGLILDTDFDFSKSHSIEILASPGGNIFLVYDGVKFIPEQKVYSNIQFSNLKLGGGFDSSRNFDGLISNWHIERLSMTVFNWIYMTLYLCLFLVLGLVISVAKNLPRSELSNEKS